MLDIKALKERLIAQCETVCAHLFPAGTIIAHEFRVGDLSGTAGKSLAVNLRGADRGAWCDFAFPGDPAQRGDLISLWMGARNQSLKECFPEMLRFVGITKIERPAPKPRPLPPSIDALASMRGTPVHAYLNGRGIGDETLKKYRVRVYKRTSEWNTDFVAFQFCDPDGAPVMLKAIGLNRKPGGTKDIYSTKPWYTLFGWWTVPQDCRRIGISEGEIDCLSISQLAPGYPVLSLPAGASNVDFLENDWDRLQLMERIDLYTDMDGAGEAAAQTIAKRLGISRCYRIPIPKPFKDANEALLKAEPEQLEVSAWIEAAYTFDPPTLRSVAQSRDEGFDWLRRRRKAAEASTFIWPGFPFQFRNGELTIVSGTPDSGKSTFLYQTHLHEMTLGEKVLFISFEIPVGSMLVSFATIFLGHLPNDEEFDKACEWMSGKLWYYQTSEDPKFIDVLQDIQYAVQRFGITRVVVDSLFFVVGKEDYEGQDNLTRRLKSTAKQLNIHVALVAHAIVKQKAEIIPGMESVEGSGGMMKAIDGGITVHRNPVKEEKIEEAKGDPEKLEAAAKIHDGTLFLWKSREDGRHRKMKLWFHPESRSFRTKPDEPAPVPAEQATNQTAEMF